MCSQNIGRKKGGFEPTILKPKFDIYTEAFHRLNITFSMEEVPWPRCLDSVKNGDYDAIIDKGTEDFLVTGTHPTAFYPLAVYVRKDFPQAKFSWEGITGKRVGMVRGYGYTKGIRKFQGWIVDEATTDELVFKKLQAKRYDYAVFDIFVAPLLEIKYNVQIKQLRPFIGSRNLYLAFSKDNSEIAKKYDQTIEKMLQDGTIDKIYKGYLPYSYSYLLQETFGVEIDK